MKQGRTRSLLAWGLAAALGLSLTAPVLPGTARAAEVPPDTEGLNCREMTELWFGPSDTVSLFSDSGAGTPEDALSAYFSGREEDYYPDDAVRLFSADEAPVSDRVQEEREKRAEQIDRMQAEQGITITDAAVTVKLDRGSFTVTDGVATAYAYEWTFYDYDDLSDGPGGSDVAGYGTWHRLTLAPSPSGDGYTVLSDEYDESDILGLDTIRPATRADADAARLLTDRMEDPWDDWEEATASDEELAVLMDGDGIVFYEDYDLDKMQAYSDKYCLQYNPAYFNYNPVGGDCANFTSQCIYAGGMPMERGTKYGTDGWYYGTTDSHSVTDDRSATWTSASRLCAWMGTHRGYEVVATASSVYRGSPCFYNNKHHATICVGYNSAGVPIINSHNSDRYHVKWNYWTPTEIYTVQLTRGPGGPLSISGAQYPQGTLPKGEPFSLRGVITSDETILSVSAAVYDTDGNAVLSCSQQWDSTRYDIRTDGIDDRIIFNDLDTGDYTYAVTASDASGATKTLVESAFTIGGSTLGITGAVFPTGTVTMGLSQDLGGVISSNYALSIVQAYIFDASDHSVDMGANYIFDSSDTAVMYYEWTGDGQKKTYNIATGGLDAAFLFGGLPERDYTYVVNAADASGTEKTLLNQPFTVTAGSIVPDAPSVKVSGTEVSMTWGEVPGAARYDVYLMREPWGWGSKEKNDVTTALSYSFSDVAAGEYRVFYRARIDGTPVQSPWSDRFTVGESSLTLSGWLDGEEADTIAPYGTVDVWVNGAEAAAGVSEWQETVTAGSAYELRNIRPAEGYSFNGIHSGSRTGSAGGDVAVSLDFSTVDTQTLPPVSKTDTFQNRTYRLVTTACTRYAAERYCEAMGGHLATVSSQEEQDFLRDLCGYRVTVWLGASDAETEDQWHWDTGGELTYQNWMSLKPDNDTNNDEGSENYLYLTTSGLWDDSAGYELRAFVCEVDEAPTDDPADTPTDNPADNPTDDPADNPTDDPADNPTDDPADNPTDDPADNPADDPADNPADDPADNPTDDPADDPADNPTDDPADNPTDDPADDPADNPADDPADNPTDDPADKPTDDPADKPTDDPADNPADDPADKPADPGALELSGSDYTEENGSAVLTAAVRNTTDADADGLLIAVLYKEDRMADCFTQPVAVHAGETEEVPVRLALPGNGDGQQDGGGTPGETAEPGEVAEPGETGEADGSEEQAVLSEEIAADTVTVRLFYLENGTLRPLARAAAAAE